jgi:hypothetical protein
MGLRDHERTVFIIVAVADPIMDLKLNPRSREQVERRGRLELGSGHQFEADGSRAWREKRAAVRQFAIELASPGITGSVYQGFRPVKNSVTRPKVFEKMLAIGMVLSSQDQSKHLRIARPE